MPANVDTATSNMERCVSCDAALSGPYCSRCGERALEPDALTLRHFLVHTVAHELLHVDGTWWRTLKLLFVRPGRLSLEYAAGRRRPYINPFRLLLIAIVLYTLLSSSGLVVTWNFGPVTVSMAPATIKRSLPVEDAIHQIDRYGLLRRQLAAKKEQLAGETARERFHDRLATFAQPVSFANVILLAAALHLAFRRKRRRFLEHAAFSMHFVSFILLSSLTMPAQVAGRISAIGVFPVLAVAVRVFDGRDPPVLSGHRSLGQPTAVDGRGDAHLRTQLRVHDGGAGGRRGDRARLGVARSEFWRMNATAVGDGFTRHHGCRRTTS
jgi:hypothetical protein